MEFTWVPCDFITTWKEQFHTRQKWVLGLKNIKQFFGEKIACLIFFSCTKRDLEQQVNAMKSMPKLEQWLKRQQSRPDEAAHTGQRSLKTDYNYV